MNQMLADATIPLRKPIDGGHRPMFIDGQWVESLSGERLETRNPANGRLLATVPSGTKEDVDRAVKAARRAFHGPWSRMKPFERQALLLRIADLFEKHWEEISASDTQDMGLPISRTRANRLRVVGMLRYYAGMATAITGDTIRNSIPGDVFSMTVREPVGVVGAIIPWNAPTASSIWKIGPALATGCTIVLKPSEDAPLTPLLIADIMAEAGVPDGVVNIVTGTGASAGAALAEHPDVNKLVFTGSTLTGQAIVRASAVGPKRVSLELGGKSPLIICADADLDKAVPIAAMAVYAHSGQICIAGSRLFVEAPIHDEFVQRLVAFSKGLRIGDGMQADTQIGPVVSRRQLDKIMGYIEQGREGGAQLMTGGRQLTDADLAAGHFVEPTIFADVEDDMVIAREEIFGPVISALRFEEVGDVIARANDTPYGLAAGVFTRDIGKAHRIASALQAGSVFVNGYHLLDPAVPFGGYKSSGYGREGGAEQIDGYLNTKAIWIDTN
nr:aldehyde dehydrogenase family protein [Aureimonas sp. N4]